MLQITIVKKITIVNFFNLIFQTIFLHFKQFLKPTSKKPQAGKLG